MCRALIYLFRGVIGMMETAVVGGTSAAVFTGQWGFGCLELHRATFQVRRGTMG